MSGKDGSVTSREALMGTKAGKQILKQGLFKSRGFRLFNKYRDEYKAEFPRFQERFAGDLLREIKSDGDPGSTQDAFAEEIGSPEMALRPSEITPIRAKLEDPAVLGERVSRILDSNFVKMTFPVFSALYDAAAHMDGRDDPELKQNLVDGHIIAIDLSEPMDRIMDRDEDLEYLDDYKLMNPYILKLARAKIARGGKEVLDAFEAGFRDARAGQHLDVQLKSRPARITEEEMAESYKKYRAVMGTAGRNMALASRPLGEIFCLGMARAAECVGCGNEIEDSIKGGAVKVPSWPLYYSLLAGDVRKGFELTMEKGGIYLQDARIAAGLLPDNSECAQFLDFLFLTVEHYNQFWYNRLQDAAPWERFEAALPRDI